MVTTRELRNYSLTTMSHDLDDNHLLQAIFSPPLPMVKGRTNNPDVFRSNILSCQMVGLILSPTLKEIRSEIGSVFSTMVIKGKNAASMGYLYAPENAVSNHIQAFADQIKALV